MLKDSDRINHPRPNVKYVDRTIPGENTPEQIQRLWLALGFYISYHAKRNISGKYMPQAVLMMKQATKGGTFDVSHDDFRLIIIFALFFAKHFGEAVKDYGEQRHVDMTGKGEDDQKKMKGFAKYLLTGEFKETMPKAKRAQFSKMRRNHASIQELLKL